MNTLYKNIIGVALMALVCSGCTKSPMVQLIESVESGNKEEVIRALGKVDFRKLKLPPHDGDPVAIACSENRALILPLLLDAGAPIIYKEGDASPVAVECALRPVTYPTSKGYTSLQDAEQDSLKLLRILQKHGVGFKSSGYVGHIFGDSQPTLAIVQFMVREMGLKPTQNWDNAEECPIRMVAKCGERPEVMAYMLQQGRVSKSRQETLLVDTLNGGNDVMLEFFFKHGFTPNSLVTDGNGQRMTVKEYAIQQDSKLLKIGDVMQPTTCLEFIEKWEKSHGIR